MTLEEPSDPYQQNGCTEHRADTGNGDWHQENERKEDRQQKQAVVLEDFKDFQQRYVPFRDFMDDSLELLTQRFVLDVFLTGHQGFVCHHESSLGEKGVDGSRKKGLPCDFYTTTKSNRTVADSLVPPFPHRHPRQGLAKSAADRKLDNLA